MQSRWKRYIIGILYLTYGISLSYCCEENLEWECKSGDCLEVQRVCDGFSDCPDGSDETVNTCLQTDCPTFAFRCTYGACVHREAQCNGTLECADGSDEADRLCKPDKIISNTICSSHEFQCDSGACIGPEDVCNGQPNCEDNSDETVKTCAANSCPAPYFQCGYGACINVNKKCDGNVDCHDGSDENSCETRSVQSTTESPKAASTRATTISTRLVIPDTPCKAPNIENSVLVYANNPTKRIEPGETIPSGKQILYKCRKTYYREGQDTNVCRNGNWNSEDHPICTRYCRSDMLNGVTFRATCKYDNAVVSCNDRIKPGTIAETYCRTNYRIPEKNPPQRLLCEEDGDWDYRPSRCEPICGKELIESVPFAVNGEITNITAVPWHVAIYRNFDERYKHNCGGSILNANVVITAAHCFWDDANEKLFNETLYLVGAGKSFRNYTASEPRLPQFRNISKIYVPQDFRGVNNYFRADIAILVLSKSLTFTEYVSPICTYWEKGAAKSLASDTYGQVAGWGKDETGTFSEELKTIYVPMSSYEVCQKEVGAQLANSITDDKFCVLNKYNQNVCNGDSGGGFVVKKENRHYLWGTVSNGVPYSASCSNYEFVNYLNIQYYQNFISQYEAPNRPT